MQTGLTIDLLPVEMSNSKIIARIPVAFSDYVVGLVGNFFGFVDLPIRFSAFALLVSSGLSRRVLLAPTPRLEPIWHFSCIYAYCP
jgi:hypothetical protein